MANTFDLDDRAFEFFAAEVPELLQILESGLLDLSADSTTAEVHEMMRAAHSIKGGAASVGLDTIKTLSHRLEDFLKALYSEAASVDDDVKTLLLHSYDCLKDPLQLLLETGTFDEEAALANAEPYFETLELVLGDALAASQNFIPSSEDLGVDIAASIFEVDVAEGIERLKSVLSSPDDYEVAGELRTQLEVFSGFSELLNLKGFGTICSTATVALERDPSKVLEIMALAIADFEAGRAAVLEGDRSMGGSPSCELQAMATGNVAPGESSVESTDSASNSGVDATVLEDAGLTDLFGSLAENASTEVLADELNSELAADGALDDVFGAFTEEDLGAGDFSTESVADGAVEDVFGAFALDDFAETDEADSSSSLAADGAVDDVFGELAADWEESAPAASEDLQDVFGAIADDESGSQSIDLANEQAAISASAADLATDEDANVDDIFGALASGASDSAASEPASALPTGDALTTIPSTTNAPLPIEARLQRVQQAFADLPQDSSATSVQDSKTDDSQKPAAAKPASRKSTPKIIRPTVRVEIERLDRMGNQLGELSIMQNSLALQQAQLQRAIKELQRRNTLFKDYIKQLGTLADEIVISPERFGKVGDASTGNSAEAVDSLDEQWQDAGFDSLEMDRYGTLYSSLQTLLEESALLEEASDDVVLYSRQSSLTLGRQEKQLQQLQDELTWARMLPLKNVLQRFPRTVHEMSRKFGKRVNLVLDGTWVLVDKSVLEKIYDPLLHLMRNAFDHGIEPPELRQQLGKPEEGTITIRAYYQGSETIIEMSDDGRGIDPERVREKALSKGLLSTEQAQQVPDLHIIDCLFEPGFSTADSVSELSGRGIGLDVVRVQLRELKGKVGVTSELGRGTTFTLRLPFTLTMTKLLVCTVNSSAVAFSSDNIEEVYVPTSETIREEGGHRYLTWRETVVPIRPLSRLLEYKCPVIPLPESKALQPIDTPDHWASPVLVVKNGSEYEALEVERLVTEQELAIKPLGAAITPPPYLYGCTVLADGTLVPVLDAIALMNSDSSLADDSTPAHSGLDSTSPSPFSQRQVATILVVDDSVAQRRSLIQSCQRAGYRVLQASNGQEALSQLEQGSRVDGIICDIEMPKMNGFEFLTIRRQNPNFANIPVAMLTSRSSQKHHQLALQLGASAYLTKPYLEQELLATLQDMCASASPAGVS